MGASHSVTDKWEPFQDQFSDSAPEVPPTFRRISAIFLKFLPIVVGGTRLRVARAVQHAG